MQNSEASRKLETDEYLSKAYKYGADLVPINPEEEKEFYQFPAGAPGMLIRGFIDEKEVGYERNNAYEKRRPDLLSSVFLVPPRVGSKRLLLDLGGQRSNGKLAILGSAMGYERVETIRLGQVVATYERGFSSSTENMHPDTESGRRCCEGRYGAGPVCTGTFNA